MKLSLHKLELPLEYEFTISRGSMTSQRSLVVQLDHAGLSGFGETTENSYYGFSLERIAEDIKGIADDIEAYEFGHPEDLWRRLQPKLAENAFALSAIDIAAYDLLGKIQGRRTYELMDFKWEKIPESSYTIGIDSIDKMVAKLQAHPNWNIYKIKLGTENDVEIIRKLRQVTPATFRVDANCGWTADETISNSYKLRELGVEFIEQPLAPDISKEQHIKVFQQSALPIIADENCQVESDVEDCAGLFHGINVKLCKCGGLTPALRMLRKAKQLGMKTMVGCMVESSIGISGAAQLLPLLDYADLDGAVLLSHDPGEGVSVNDGKIQLGQRFGNGAFLH